MSYCQFAVISFNYLCNVLKTVSEVLSLEQILVVAFIYRLLYSRNELVEKTTFHFNFCEMVRDGVQSVFY